MQEITHNSSTHKLGYHIVFCTKYRHPVLIDAVEVECKTIFAEICKSNNWLLHGIEIMPDHVHLFVQLDLETAPNHAVRLFKGISAVHLFKAFPKLKERKFWGSGMWSRGAYYTTVGSISQDSIKRYIKMQKEKPNSSNS